MPTKRGLPSNYPRGGYTRVYNPSQKRWIRSGYRRPSQAPARSGYRTVARTRGWAGTGEMKYFDCERTAVALSAPTTTWVAGTLKDPNTTIDLGDAAVATPACLFAPKVSAALNGRIGRNVHMMKIKIHGKIGVPIQAVQSAADSATRVRLILVMDTQTNATAMTSAQLLRDAGEAATTMSSFQNPNNFGRFRVLKEKNFNLTNINMANDTGATGGIIQSGMVINWKLTYNFKNPVKVQFNATNGGTIADIIDNSVHVIAGIDGNSLAPQISYYSRVAYKE